MFFKCLDLLHISGGLGTFLEQPSFVKNHYFLCRHRNGLCNGLKIRQGVWSEVMKQTHDRDQLNCSGVARFYDYVPVI